MYVQQQSSKALVAIIHFSFSDNLSLISDKLK